MTFSFYYHLAPTSQMIPPGITACLHSVCLACVSHTMWKYVTHHCEIPWHHMFIQGEESTRSGCRLQSSMKGACLQFHPHSRVGTHCGHFLMIKSLSALKSLHSWSLFRFLCVCVCASKKKNKTKKKQVYLSLMANMQLRLLLSVSPWERWCFIIEVKDFFTHNLRDLSLNFTQQRKNALMTSLFTSPTFQRHCFGIYPFVTSQRAPPTTRAFCWIRSVGANLGGLVF